MASSRRYIISSALFIQLLMLSAVASPLADGVNPLGDFTKMNDDLLEELENNDNSKLIPVIFQLNSPMTDSDETQLEDLGFELLGRAPLVDGGLVEGTIGEVRELSNWDRIEYLELDKPLEFFYLPSEFGGEPTTDAGIMMHETTHVVTATDSWSRAIISPTGEVEYEIDQSFTEWDGDGTAIVDLDTGVDAGHPDYDYLEPWTGDKAIYSAKFDGVGWTETRNSDTSSGHGTHVGGTIAGNGDASS